MAEGTELWKCKMWDFASQTCQGNWDKLMDLIPGEEYSFDISQQDPGFTETTPSTGTPDGGNSINLGNVNSTFCSN